jgi:Asp-tRNA(Asn)/Glu-tRNA(Gln) amidotransferase A subunit family amidase
MASHSELLSFDVATLGEKIRTREISPVEVTEAYLERIDHSANGSSLISPSTATTRVSLRAMPKPNLSPANGAARSMVCRSHSKTSAIRAES